MDSTDGHVTDGAGLTDEFVLELNPVDSDDTPTSPQLPAVPERPADDAGPEAWVAYCVALGADEAFLTQTTEHWDTERSRRGEIGALDKDTLIRLATHLGG